ncbi:MAG: nucleoside deaminase [Alphaproteobacteria bacterium]|nr:nucleoside deaminase [Alphaproteobacteria bacterium]
MKDEVFMRRAIELARAHSMSGAGGPFGAVVVKDGKIVGEGWNRVTSTNDPTAHAEVVAIREACKALGTFDLTGATVYTSCEPCPMCLCAILWARADRMCYAANRRDAAEIEFDDEAFYVEVAKDIDKRDLPTSNVLRDEARAVFAEWFAKPDKVAY